MRTRIEHWTITMILLSFFTIQAAPFTPDANMKASDVPNEYKWDLTPLCSSNAQWQTEIDQCELDLKALSEMHNALSSPKGIADYMQAYFNLDDRINRLTLYANLQRETATTNQAVIARHQTALTLTEGIMQEGAILRQTILGLSDSELENAISKAPELKTLCRISTVFVKELTECFLLMKSAFYLLPEIISGHKSI